MYGGNVSMYRTTATSCSSKGKKNIVEFAADIYNGC
jgi:hypothetical protein